MGCHFARCLAGQQLSPTGFETPGLAVALPVTMRFEAAALDQKQVHRTRTRAAAQDSNLQDLSLFLPAKLPATSAAGLPGRRYPVAAKRDHGTRSLLR